MPTAPAHPGPVRVMAAASLTDVVEAGADALEADDDTWVLASPVFGGSQDLARQLAEGADADVIALADTEIMDVLVDGDLVEDPVVFATSRLAIAVSPDNPKGIERLEDLARDDVRVVLADPSVPAGRYAAQALARAEVEVRPRSLELDVRSALAKVTSGDADAAIVYVTDVRSSDGAAEAVDIPEEDNVVARYPVAVVRRAADPAAARAYVEELVSGRLQQLLRDAGFGAP